MMCAYFQNVLKWVSQRLKIFLCVQLIGTENLNLIFMDPCIVVWLSRNNRQDATL